MIERFKRTARNDKTRAMTLAIDEFDVAMTVHAEVPTAKPAVA